VHEAGGSEAQELAAIIGSVTIWLRALQESGTKPAAALPFFGASLSVDRDQWLSIAKLRALRLLWARLLELCDAPQLRLPIHAETSGRMMTRTDPHTNIMRTTIAAFAAAVGGADSIAVLPFTAALGRADDHARALARNTQHLLTEESQLHRVADPAAGSGAVEALTAALAESAWREFQLLEREGGLLRSLHAGHFQARIAAAREALRAELANGKGPLVGSTIYRQAGVEPDSAASEAVPGGLSPVRLEELAQGLAG
jgi:methylmalonyl-CoA mutase